MEFITAPVSLILFIMVTMLICVHHFIKKIKQKNSIKLLHKNGDSEEQPLKLAPGPKPLPFIGNLLKLAKYEENPYHGFCEMSTEYGSLYKLYLGSTPAYIVSDYEHMKEVLIKKGHHFDSRPDFKRWNTFFDGDRQQCKFL